MKLAILAVVVILLSGCANLSLENSIGVDPDDNAVLCATVEIDPVWTDSRATYSRVELPSNQQVTPEQLAALVAACGR